ncbi:MAG TPA: site-2 protease family protein [Anaerolineae bacterium]
MSTLVDDTSSTLLSAAEEVLTIESVTTGDGAARGLAPVMTRRGPALPGRKPAAPPTPESLLLSHAVLGVSGVLQVPADEAHRRLSERMNPLGYTPVLRGRQHAGEASLYVLPMTFTQSRANVRLAVVLFGLTVLSCLFVGSMMATGEVTWNLLAGVPYAASLLAILVAHEFGHYITARRLGAPVSLPYFIPLPLPPLGTLGAVINMPAPPRDRRQLFAVGVAGPLAGLIVALPILWYGLSLSQVGGQQPGFMQEGNSLLYAAIKFLHFGLWLPGGGQDVYLHPVAFAGWAGLLVTALNLIPAGQLDGGHVIYSLLGPKWAERILWVILLGLAGLAFFWTGWLLWVVLIFVVSRLRTPLLNDITALTGRQRALGVLMLIVFVLVFTPIPMR